MRLLGPTPWWPALLLGLAGCTGGPSPSFGSGGSHNEAPGEGSSGDGSSDEGGGDESGGDESGGDEGGSSDDTAGGDEGGGEEGGDEGTVIEGTGTQQGDVIYELADDSGFSLHALVGSPIVLLAGHMDVATTTDTFEALAGVESASVVTVAYLGRTELQTAPTEEDQARWLAESGVDYVLIDTSLTEVDAWTDSTATKTYVIDEDMVISWLNYGVTAQGQLEDKLDAL